MTRWVCPECERKFAEIRPMARALSVELYLPRAVEHERIVRHLPIGAGRVVNIVRLRGADEVSEPLLAWLTEAYAAAAGAAGT